MTGVPYIASSSIFGFSSPLGNVQLIEKSSVLMADSFPLSVLATITVPSALRVGPAQPCGLFCLTQPAAASMARARNARTGSGWVRAIRRMLFSLSAAPTERDPVWAGARLSGRTCLPRGRLGYGIQAAGVEGVTAEEAPQGEEAAFQHTVALHGLVAVVRAGGLEATGRRAGRRDGPLVPADEGEGRTLHDGDSCAGASPPRIPARTN